MRNLLCVSLLVLGIGVTSAAQALAQDAIPPTSPGDSQTSDDPTSTAGQPSTMETPKYDALSPGNKMIARSLFDAQGPVDSVTSNGDASASTRWTLEQIAGARGDGQGWGNVFQQMKAEGAIAARNLGQVVSRYHGAPPPATPVTATAPRSILITSGSNDTGLVSPRASHGAGGRATPSASAAGGRAHISQSLGHAGGVGGASATITGGGPAWASGGGISGNGGGHGQANGRSK